jgi:hypothetical protein
MGINKLPSYEFYWKKKNNIFYQSFVDRTFTYDRFCEIKKYFHVFDNEAFTNMVSSGIVTTKLDGLIQYFNKKFNSVFTPKRELAIDENLCSWSGKGGSKVYMPFKPIKYGLKLYALCEAESGYVCKVILYNSNNKDTNLEIIKN